MIERRLEASIAPFGRVIVAFSGGVDSAVVLAAASRALNADVLAVTASSPSVAQGEVESAAMLAREIGVAHEIVLTREFDDARYRANASDRC
ncbi:MAG TPA: 7-cyano-7-deazaguanine synthase, partial [Candidatus Eremiobacteraceae bacterium]|nr:7-cyano-7-deazaguanine synthase [Candidatus Eremiobacteraceae bacterium]